MTTADYGTDALKDEFAAEVSEHLEKIEKKLLLLEKQGEGYAVPEIISDLFRAIHSIKGAAGFMGFVRIGELAHALETLLQLMRKGDIEPDRRYIDALLSGNDLLKTMADDLDSSNDMDIRPMLDRIDALIESAGSLEIREKMNTPVKLTDAGGRDPGFEITALNLDPISPGRDRLYVLKYDLHEIEKDEGIRLLSLIRRLLKKGRIIDTLIRTDAVNFDRDFSDLPLMCHVLYATDLEIHDLEILSGLGRSKIDEVVRDGLDRPDKKAPPPPVGPDRIVGDITREKTDREKRDETGAPLPETVFPRKSRRHADTVRIRVSLLERLMKIAGEMVLVRNNLLAMTESDQAYRQISQRLNIATTELQETVMQTRLQPVDHLFSKLPRIVRDLSGRLGKRIEIHISGGEVELDRTLLESIADPLTHLIRNACDHGIELPGIRKKNGKSGIGQIEVHAAHEAGFINIRVQDDGRGMNSSEIGLKAVEAGLKTEEEVSRMADGELLNLIMTPGFSTVGKISSVSGRGVGMDVVKAGIEKTGGFIEIGSRPGKGTQFHLRIPLTLAIIPCMIIQAGERRYAIPQVNVKELLCLYNEDVYTRIECTGDQEVFRLRNRLLPIVRLDEVLKRDEPFTEETRAGIAHSYAEMGERAAAGRKSRHKMLNFAVVKMGSGRYGLVVDDILGVEEIVVNPMHPALKSLGIYFGTTIMGDGSVALILDVEGVAEHAAIRFNRDEKTAARTVTAETDSQTVLLFKNGPHEQFAVPLPMIRRVEQIRTSAIEKVGKREFVGIDGIPTPILHLENCLKVSPGVEREEMLVLLPKHIRRPFGILISEVVDTVRTDLNLNLESYMEAGIMGTAIVRDRMTLFLDLYRLIERVEPDWFEERKKQAPSPEKRTRVLLVEDTPFFRNLVSGYLHEEGYDVTAAENGKAALDKMGENPFDIIVSDLDMPLMDGWTFMKNVRQESGAPGIPAIALTALDSEEDRNRAEKAGFDAYQVKLDREALLVNVSALLNRKSG